VSEEYTVLPVPKNLSDFTDNLVMITILQIVKLQKWTIVSSPIEMRTAAFKTEKAMYFAGFVSKSYDEFVGPRIKASNLYEKGQLAAQTKAVLASVGKRNAHIRKVEHSPGGHLSEMKGFTKELWGIRGSLSNLFNQLPLPKVADIDLPSYMFSGGEILGKMVKTRLPFENGGVFRPTELDYFRKKYQAEIKLLADLQVDCRNPTKDFALNFWERVDEVTKASGAIEKALGAVYAQRAKFLFRSGSKKKNDLKWAKQSLEEKLNQMTSEEIKKFFDPCNLPGLPRTRTFVQDKDLELVPYCEKRYGITQTHTDYMELLGVVASYEDLYSSAVAEEARI
jgi:hypothetical protein